MLSHFRLANLGVGAYDTLTLGGSIVLQRTIVFDGGAVPFGFLCIVV